MSNRVRDYRAQAGGMTQQQLADAVGVTRQTINAIEASKYSPSLEVAFLIARSLDATIEEIFSISED
ncbi:MAG TPA: helix-turn-helix transcriptional regulator [Xanthomonadales bacterium]|nr:helix-turn-helix transcriptional regulator [Xanthomonadales bacterium]